MIEEVEKGLDHVFQSVRRFPLRDEADTDVVGIGAGINIGVIDSSLAGKPRCTVWVVG